MLHENGNLSVPKAVTHGGTARRTDVDRILAEDEHAWSLSACILQRHCPCQHMSGKIKNDEKERLWHMYCIDVRIRNKMEDIGKWRYMIEMRHYL